MADEVDRLAMPEVRIEMIDHTGDAGLRIAADSLELVLTTCAEQMVRLCCPQGEIRSRITRPVAIEGNDLVELLVGWLGEINCLMSIHRELYGSFRIRQLDVPQQPPLHLEGSASGEAIDPARHLLEREIKAVTFHEAYLREERPLWRAQVIFDL